MPPRKNPVDSVATHSADPISTADKNKESGQRVAQLYLAILDKDIERINAVLGTLVDNEIVATLRVTVIDGAEPHLLYLLRSMYAAEQTPIEFAYNLKKPKFLMRFLRKVLKYYSYESIFRYYVEEEKFKLAVALLTAKESMGVNERQRIIGELMRLAIKAKDKATIDELLDAENNPSISLTTLVKIIDFVKQKSVWPIAETLLVDLQAFLVMQKNEAKELSTDDLALLSTSLILAMITNQFTIALQLLKLGVKVSGDDLALLSAPLLSAMSVNEVDIAVRLLKMGVRVGSAQYISAGVQGQVITFDASTKQYRFQLDGPDTPRGKMCNILSALFNLRGETAIQMFALDYLLSVFNAGSFGQQLGVVNEIENADAKRALIDGLETALRGFQQMKARQPKSDLNNSTCLVLTEKIAQLASARSSLVKAAKRGAWEKVQAMLEKPNPDEALENYCFVLNEAVSTKQDGTLILTLLSLGATTNNSFVAMLPGNLMLQYEGGEAPKLSFKNLSQPVEEVSLTSAIVPDKFLDVVQNIVNQSTPALKELRACTLKIMTEYFRLLSAGSGEHLFFICSSLISMCEAFKSSTKDKKVEVFITEQYRLLVTGRMVGQNGNDPEGFAPVEGSALKGMLQL